MTNSTPSRIEDFSKDDLHIIFEAARIGLADDDTFHDIARQMDRNDWDMVEVRESLTHYMNIGGECPCLACLHSRKEVA